MNARLFMAFDSTTGVVRRGWGGSIAVVTPNREWDFTVLDDAPDVGELAPLYWLAVNAPGVPWVTCANERQNARTTRITNIDVFFFPSDLPPNTEVFFALVEPTPPP